jgi:ribosome maturation factor RimP
LIELVMIALNLNQRMLTIDAPWQPAGRLSQWKPLFSSGFTFFIGELMREIIESLARKACASAGVTFYDVETKPGHPIWSVVLYITTSQGVTVDQCAQVSHILSEELDKVDPIPARYVLEVSSAGLDRKLTRLDHWAGAVGEKVKFTIEREGRQVLVSGTLLSVNGEEITVAHDKIEETFRIPDLKKTKTVFDMNAEMKRR